MRFYKPGQTQYQSQFAPLNLDFMQKNLAQKEENDMLTQDLLDKTGQLQVEGGMLSDPNEVKKYNDWIQTNTAAVRDKFYAGELDAREAARNLSKITQFYNTNEDIKFFNTDKQLSAATRARIAQGKANGALSSNISYLDGELSTTPLSSKAGLDALARGHNLTNPTGMYDAENYKAQYADLKARIKGTSWETEHNVQEISPGVMAVVNQDGKTVNTQLTRQMIREIASTMAPLEIQNSNTPWVQYQKMFYDKHGVDYTPEQWIEDFTNSYTGIVDNTTTENKRNAQVLSGGSGNKNNNPPPNQYTTPLPGAETPYGFDPNDIVVSHLGLNTIGVNGADIADKNSNFYKEIAANKVGPPNARQIGHHLKQPKDMSETTQKFFYSWLNNSHKWDHQIPGAKGKYEIPQGTLVAMYHDFMKDNKEYYQDFIKTNNSATPITKGSGNSEHDAIWDAVVGVDKSGATVGDVIRNVVKRGSKVYSMKDKRILTPEEVSTLGDMETTGKQSLGNIDRINNENMMSYVTQDDTFKNGLIFATNEGAYVIQDFTRQPWEVAITDAYQKAKMATNQPVEINYYDGSRIKYKINKDNLVTLYDNNNKPYKQYSDITNMFNDLAPTRDGVQSDILKKVKLTGVKGEY